MSDCSLSMPRRIRPCPLHINDITTLLALDVSSRLIIVTHIFTSPFGRKTRGCVYRDFLCLQPITDALKFNINCYLFFDQK